VPYETNALIAGQARSKIGNFAGFNDAVQPQCAALLGAMVLAACRMAPEEEGGGIDESDYFCRLRTVLGMTGSGRPRGMLPAGIEESLWQNWNKWLREQGWMPTAVPGEGAWRFIRYPVSQTVLRDGEKTSIANTFCDKVQEGRLSRSLDRSAIGAWLRNPNNLPNRRHMRDIIAEGDLRQLEAFTEAAFTLYSSIDWDSETIDVTKLAAPTRLSASIYRIEDLVEGPQFFLYPMMPRGGIPGVLTVQAPDKKPVELERERTGWFRPLWKVAPDKEIKVVVNDPEEQIRQLILPKRGFWILVRDPEDENSGAFAGWHTPNPAETFLLLCNEKYAKQLNILKEAKLIQWTRMRRWSNTPAGANTTIA